MANGGGTTNYCAYDNADRITAVTKPGPTVTSYTWDNNGNLTDRGADTLRLGHRRPDDQRHHGRDDDHVRLPRRGLCTTRTPAA
jgi:YD repeat-containing protein